MPTSPPVSREHRQCQNLAESQHRGPGWSGLEATLEEHLVPLPLERAKTPCLLVPFSCLLAPVRDVFRWFSDVPHQPHQTQDSCSQEAMGKVKTGPEQGYTLFNIGIQESIPLGSIKKERGGCEHSKGQ